MSDLLAYSFGGAIFQAAIFFPITFVAMRSQVRFRGDLGSAWRPFFYVVVLLTIAKAVETGSGGSHSAATLPGFSLFLVVPIAVSAAVLFLTFRQKRERPASASGQPPQGPGESTDAEKIGSEIINAILENDPVKVAEAVQKAHASGAPVTRVMSPIDRRGLVLAIAAAVAVLMLLFPPFHLLWQGNTNNFGYAWLFKPPHSRGYTVATVDVLTLLMEYVGLLVVTVLLYLAISPERRKHVADL